MTLFNSYYPPQDHNYDDEDRLKSLYQNYKTVTDCVCEDMKHMFNSEFCLPSLIILLHQMHQEISSLKEQVEYLKDPERYEYAFDCEQDD